MSNPAGQDLYKQGLAQFKSGNYQEASALFLKIIDQDEENHKAWNALGVVCTKVGRYVEADECYEKALTLAPNTAPYQRNQERNLANMGPKESLPFTEVSENADTWLKKGRVLRDLNEFEEAIEAFDQAIKINPNNAETWYEKGQSLWDRGKFEEAVVAFDHAIKIDPNNFYVYDSKAWILRYELNRQEESIEVYDQAIRNIQVSNAILYQKAFAYEGLKKFDIRDESLTHLDQIIRNIRQCYSMLHNKGDGLYHLGKFEEAIEAFDQVTKLNKELAWVNYCQGTILSLLPKEEEGPEEGIQLFNNAHENFQDVEKTFYLKGLALGRLGRFEESIAAINQAIRIDPKYADAIPGDDA